MDTRTEMLAHARHADLERLAARRRQDGLLSTCRRWVFGIFPVAEACEPCDAA